MPVDRVEYFPGILLAGNVCFYVFMFPENKPVDTLSHRAPLTPLVGLVVVSPLVTPPPPVYLCLRLSPHHSLSPHPSYASCLAGCRVTSCHATTSCPPVPPPLIPPLSCFLSGWLLHRLSSHCHLSSTCASTSHCTAASHHAPLMPLVWLVVASLLATPPPPIHLRLRLSLCPSRACCPAGCCLTARHATTASHCLHLHLSLCRCLSSRPSHATFLSGCRVTSHHAALSRPPALRLSSHHHLSWHPSCASCLAGCCFASCHAATSCQPAPLPLRALPSTGGVATGGGGIDVLI